MPVVEEKKLCPACKKWMKKRGDQNSTTFAKTKTCSRECGWVMRKRNKNENSNDVGQVR